MVSCFFFLVMAFVVCEFNLTRSHLPCPRVQVMWFQKAMVLLRHNFTFDVIVTYFHDIKKLFMMQKLEARTAGLYPTKMAMWAG